MLIESQVVSLLLSIGALVLAGSVLWDQFITVFTTSGAGPLTRFGSHVLWRALLRVHGRRRIHRVLALAGPAMLLLSILFWYLLFGVAVFMAFLAHPGSVINDSTSEPASALETLYFTSTTISSLGYGDWVPAGFPWTIMATLATLVATIILTVSLSYVLSVVSAAIQRRSLASGIFGIGPNVREIIANVQLSDPQASLKNYLLSLSAAIDNVALQHLAYPVLKYFHAAQAGLSPARAVLTLADTLFVIELSAESAPSGVVRVLRSSIERFARFSHEDDLPEKIDKGLPDSLQELLEGELAVPVESINKGFEGYRSLRNRLVALCGEDGWLEEDLHDAI